MVLLQQLLLNHLLIRQQPRKRHNLVMELKQAHKVKHHLQHQKQPQPIEMHQMKETQGKYYDNIKKQMLKINISVSSQFTDFLT